MLLPGAAWRSRLPLATQSRCSVAPHAAPRAPAPLTTQAVSAAREAAELALKVAGQRGDADTVITATEAE